MSYNGKDNVSLVDINKEMRESYLQYSMSVIVGRALPDVRDGLKPVHRRILFAMKDLNNTHDKPFKKSARVVGDVIGKYHPHGEMAVYDAIVRMAQDFSMQAPLVDGQGNFGSIDGDSAAASRYTEIRMTALAEELLTDIEKKTVPFGPNYDDSLFIPLVLPARYPNLLVNGSSGIAVGMSCNIPPHNLGEVVQACLFLLENPSVDIPELMEILPGPDFPTAGIVEGKSALYSAYTKGRGIITVSSVTEIEEREKQSPQIVVTEIPYQVNKARLIESIANLVKDKKVEGISDIRDESSREGLRIAIPLKRGANPQVVLNQIQKHSQLKTSFGIIFLALDKSNQPRIFNLKEMLSVFIEHRIEVITHRLIFELKKAQEKLHILEGLEKALADIDKVISIIRGSQDGKQAQRELISELKFSHRQAQAILEMRLAKLTGLERKSLQKDREETARRAHHLKETLSDEEKIKDILKKELEEIKEKYQRPRRTKITAGSEELSDRDLIAKKEVVLFLTYKGLVKRIPLEEYRLQKRGGKGLKGWDLRTEGDFVWKLWSVNTLSRLLVFSSLGRLHWLDVYRVPSGLRQTKARSLNNLLSFKEEEEPRLVAPLKEESSKQAFISTITKKGILKKSRLSLFSKPRQGGVNALSIDEGDILQDAQIGEGSKDFLIYTRKGLVIRMESQSVRETGRTARGVKAIRLQEGDSVVSMEALEKKEEKLLLVITEKGYGKRVRASEFRSQNRGGRGVLGQKVTDKTGQVVCSRLVSSEQQALITTNQGQSIRFPVSEVSVFGRVSQGVRFIDLKSGERVTGATVVDEREKEEN
ncbi:MAG: DNA gyrase subunit A [Oligoflexia bacterium]|nr:DNA gyrase subunit A [Oligoflexia bacterium]